MEEKFLTVFDNIVGSTLKVSQLIMPLKSIYIKNFVIMCFFNLLKDENAKLQHFCL